MPTRSRHVLTVCAAVAASVLLAGCGPRPAPHVPDDVIEGLVYREVDGTRLALDACLPEAEARGGTPAMLVIHGGGFTHGDRAQPNMRRLCRELADAGYAAFSIDYRLAPTWIYPSQLEDAQAAVEWLREPEQVARFGIDGSRIGVIGGSAGAVLAGTLGTRGEGPLDSGWRVAAVVSLSGAMAFTSDDPAIRAYVEEGGRSGYLGCTEQTIEECPVAAEAEPIAHVDPTDPPFYLLTSEDEFLPEQSAQLMAEALTDADVPVVVRLEPGAEHATNVLTPQIWAEILDFLAAHV
jgi:acetyl esterase